VYRVELNETSRPQQGGKAAGKRSSSSTIEGNSEHSLHQLR
jgi:hypothetical protein